MSTPGGLPFIPDVSNRSALTRDRASEQHRALPVSTPKHPIPNMRSRFVACRCSSQVRIQYSNCGKVAINIMLTIALR